MKAEFIMKSILFAGMNEEERLAAYASMDVKEREYGKGEAIFRAGTKTKRMGMILSGSVTIESNDMWGNRTILSYVGAGQFFAETYAYLQDAPMLVDVTANEDCQVALLSLEVVTHREAGAEAWHIKLLTNLLTVAARKNLILSGRSFHTAPKTIRGRVLSYLNSMSLQKKSTDFDIPFDRQQLADYLNLERSALSKELGKMQREGFIKCRKNHFRLIETGK
ncbi:MAG: Crp/Fnr family transcriptional regulator [Selenomonas ruminantium]|nr:Crp/Fnr family transcriptional regulator [Selenomonas ruminantium]